MISVEVPNGITLSEKELARMIDQYGDGLLRVCLLYLRDYASAEDAVQETFLKVYCSYAKFEGRCSEKTWVTTIAINVCRNMLRSPWRRRMVGEEALAALGARDAEMPDPHRVARGDEAAARPARGGDPLLCAGTEDPRDCRRAGDSDADGILPAEPRPQTAARGAEGVVFR